MNLPPPPPSYYSFLQTNFPVDIVPTCQTCPCQTCLLIIQVSKHISCFSVCLLHEHTCKYCKSQRGITEVAKEGVSTVHCQLSIAEGKHKLGRIVHNLWVAMLLTNVICDQALRHLQRCKQPTMIMGPLWIYGPMRWRHIWERKSSQGVIFHLNAPTF